MRLLIRVAKAIGVGVVSRSIVREGLGPSTGVQQQLCPVSLCLTNTENGHCRLYLQSHTSDEIFKMVNEIDLLQCIHRCFVRCTAYYVVSNLQYKSQLVLPSSPVSARLSTCRPDFKGLRSDLTSEANLLKPPRMRHQSKQLVLYLLSATTHPVHGFSKLQDGSACETGSR